MSMMEGLQFESYPYNTTSIRPRFGTVKPQFFKLFVLIAGEILADLYFLDKLT